MRCPPGSRKKRPETAITASRRSSGVFHSSTVRVQKDCIVPILFLLAFVILVILPGRAAYLLGRARRSRPLWLVAALMIVAGLVLFWLIPQDYPELSPEQAAIEARIRTEFVIMMTSAGLVALVIGALLGWRRATRG